MIRFFAPSAKQKHVVLSAKDYSKLLSNWSLATLYSKETMPKFMRKLPADKGRCKSTRILRISIYILEVKYYSMSLHGNNSQHIGIQINCRFWCLHIVRVNKVFITFSIKYTLQYPPTQSKASNLIMSSLWPRKNLCEFSLVLYTTPTPATKYTISFVAV